MTRSKYQKLVGTQRGPVFTNNARKRLGIPLLRKLDNRKRYYTRCEARETTNAFIDWCNYCEVEL